MHLHICIVHKNDDYGVSCQRGNSPIKRYEFLSLSSMCVCVCVLQGILSVVMLFAGDVYTLINYATFVEVLSFFHVGCWPLVAAIQATQCTPTYQGKLMNKLSHQIQTVFSGTVLVTVVVIIKVFKPGTWTNPSCTGEGL